LHWVILTPWLPVRSAVLESVCTFTAADGSGDVAVCDSLIAVFGLRVQDQFESNRTELLRVIRKVWLDCTCLAYSSLDDVFKIG